MTTEDTKIVMVPLRKDLGRDWEWFPEANVVALRQGLDRAGRVAALDDMQRTWKRRHLSLVESA